MKKKVLIEQMAQHCEAFKANFKGAAQEIKLSAMSEIDSIKDDLKKLIAKLHIILLKKKLPSKFSFFQCLL